MQTTWIVDGTYWRTSADNLPSIETVVRMESALTEALGVPLRRSVYFDLSRDVDADLSNPFFTGLRLKSLRTAFEVRLISSCISGPDTEARHDARRLLAVETAVEAVQCASATQCDRLILTASDDALEPAVASVRLRYSKELWLAVSQRNRGTVLASYADRVIALEE